MGRGHRLSSMLHEGRLRQDPDSSVESQGSRLLILSYPTPRRRVAPA